MALNEEQSAALRGLTGSGVLSAEQERAVRDALDVGSSRRESLVEIAGYVGGGLLLGGAVLVVGTSWEELTRLGRFGLLAAATAVLLVAGLGISGRLRTTSPTRRRIAGVLLALSSGTAAFAAGVLTDDRDVLVGAAVGFVVAVLGYAFLPTAAGLVAPGVTSALLAGAVVDEVAVITPLTLGVPLFALGAAWLALTRVLRHRGTGFTIGAAIAFFGAQQPFGSSEDAGWSYAMTGALALACFALYLRDHVLVLLVAGVVATTVVVPEAVWDWTGGAVSGGWLLLVGGAVLLAASGLGLRLRARHAR